MTVIKKLIQYKFCLSDTEFDNLQTIWQSNNYIQHKHQNQNIQQQFKINLSAGVSCI